MHLSMCTTSSETLISNLQSQFQRRATLFLNSLFHINRVYVNLMALASFRGNVPQWKSYTYDVCSNAEIKFG